MNWFLLIAMMVDFIHAIIAVIWIGGFFVSMKKHPEFRKAHSIFGITIFFLQLSLGMRCPLTIISGWLQEMAEPGFTEGKWLYEPFLVRVLNDTFGFQAPEIVFTVAMMTGTALMVITLVYLMTKTQSTEQ